MSTTLGLYDGSSDGAKEVVDGYVDYAMNIISARAIPDVRDGLKKVTRRILYTAYNDKKNDRFQKSAKLVGDTMGNLHPHGDGAIYGAMVLMTDENGSCNVPFLHARGGMGSVNLSDKPSAMRYTNWMINKYTHELFKAPEVMKMIPSEEGEGFEPEVLNASFPVVLVNGASGIAVATGTRMPSFNFHDVLDLVVKYIENDGKLTTDDMIIPDFPTGGVLVCNNTEIAKIMLTGKGKLKVRAKVEIEGNAILVKEVPFGKTVENIVDNINKANIREITKVSNLTGRGARAFIKIICKSKKVVEQVLMELYQKNILQNVFASSMLVINGGEPQIVGVFDVVKIWYDWYCDLMKKHFKATIDGLQEEKTTLSYFIQLTDNEEWKDEYIRLCTKVGEGEADEYLRSVLEGIPESTVSWIRGRRISAFNRGGKYRTRYETLLQLEEDCKYNIDHTAMYVRDEILALKKDNAKEFSRKTEVTYRDYRFSKVSDSYDVEDTSFCVYTLKKDGFLTKTRNFEDDGNVLCRIDARANSVLIGFDNFGRVLRIPGKEVPFTAPGDKGLYLPKYFDATFEENYKVLYLSLLDGSKKMLVYRDGYIGFFDTSEYYGKKNIRVVSKGVCIAVMDKLLHVYEEEDIPDCLLLADDTKDKIRVGVVVIDGVIEKSRLSRTKVLSGTDIDTHYLKGFKGIQCAMFISNVDSYVGKLKVFKNEWLGNPEEVLDGDYLDICKDLVPAQ